METSRSRRRAIAWIGAAALAPLACTPSLAEDAPEGRRAATPSMTEGPFYPRRFPEDRDADLTRVAGHAQAAEGIVLDVSGRLLDRSGRARSGAAIEIWQCDAHGQYHHVGEPQGSGDAGFQGYGTVATDAQGRYRFRTIRPVPYPGRTPHIHFTVVEEGRRRLTSQMFVEGEARNERDGLYRSLAREERRLVTMRLEDAPAESGARLRGALDIVLA